jgi:3'-5' exoribonuclease
MMQISTFENEMEILGFYLLKSFEVKTGKTNKQYGDVALEDKTGQINAKIWNLEGIDPEEFRDVSAVKVKGKIKEFNGTLQLNIEKIRRANAKDNIDLEDLVAAAPEKGEDMLKDVIKYADEIGDEDIRKIVLYLYNKYKDKLIYYPAAKANHHSVRSGLLFHIKKMLETAKALCVIYDSVDPDLLYAGVMLHDIAKIEEMNSTELGIVTDYSTQGELLGHITIGVGMVRDAQKELGVDEEKSMLLQHMILSHHYEAEYGSPKKPCFVEAELLHYIDMIDARVFDMDRAVKDIQKGAFSEPVFSIDRRRIYKPKSI